MVPSGNCSRYLCESVTSTILVVIPKAAVTNFTKYMCGELATKYGPGLRVNAIAPGLIETAMTELDPEFLKEALKLIPLRRMGKPEEVAALTAFLMSDAAAYITRQVIGINGGLA